MKFILDRNGVEAVNIAHVHRLAIERRIYEDGENEACVVAEMDDDGEIDVDLKAFNFGNAEENFAAAKKYLAELVASLNGGKS